MILKTSSTKSKEPRKSIVRVGRDIRAGHDVNKLDESMIDGDKVDSDEIENDEVEKKVKRLSKSKNLSKSKKTVGLDFLTFKDRLAFTKLRQTFIKAPIFHYFDLEHYI